MKSLESWFELDAAQAAGLQTRGQPTAGRLDLTDEMLRHWPSGDLFGLTQNAGMGWDPQRMAGPQFLILSTMGGMRAEDGRPIALGYHTGHWEVGLQVRAAAETITQAGGIPYAGYCSDPCDGRSQGTTGMFDSLPYRNDAAMVMRRLIRSLPTASGVMAVATCDKGLPAALMALAGSKHLPGIVVPGGVTLPPADGEDTAKVQTIGARYAHGEITLEEAAVAGCRACGSPGGGCQFLGTAATTQVVAEAMGLTIPHAALAPSGSSLWLDMARHSAETLMHMARNAVNLDTILTPSSIRNAIAVHAACGGSTNLLLHIPAIAHAAGLPRPTIDDWIEINRQVQRFVDVLPNGPVNHPTVRVYLAGGVPEIMLHLREMDAIDGECRTVTGRTWNEILDTWSSSPRRAALRQLLFDRDGVDPDGVILPPAVARRSGMTSTVVFPRGNLCPDGAVIKATAIDPSVVDSDGVFRHTGPAKVFTSEKQAIAAIKGQGDRQVVAGDVLVLAGCGPLGTGMEETYQLTSALKYIPWGKHVTIVTDARFSGVSTGACIGHVGPEALAGGPIGRVRDGDHIEVIIDRENLTGSVNLVGEDAQERLATRAPHPDLAPDPRLPADTRLWAALQQVGGGTWGGCVYDVERIIAALEQTNRPSPSPEGRQ
ncbi:MAG: YjhG/YagF family D-xylonate dehydratase [Planctomycetota bacterium]|nr:MAG: YjhG/YagF family D-xylonate dehydratase [Planctomycetota bacterium]